MTNPFASLAVVLLGRFTVKGTLSRTLSEEAKRHSYLGITIYCRDDERALLEDSFKEVADFFGERWGDYKNCMKMVMLNDEVTTHLCIPQRTCIIQRADRSRMSSITHMASWLIADVERIKYFSDHSFRMLVWGKDVPDRASEKAMSMRKNYLAGDKLDVTLSG